MSVIDEIAAERRRQVEVEGWTAEHDDEHDDMSLARAASVFAYAATLSPDDLEAQGHFLTGGGWDGVFSVMGCIWPDSWSPDWFKPKGSRRDLIRAAALIVAEVERIDRAEQSHARVVAVVERASHT